MGLSAPFRPMKSTTDLPFAHKLPPFIYTAPPSPTLSCVLDGQRSAMADANAQQKRVKCTCTRTIFRGFLNRDALQQPVAEFFGTMILVMFGCAGNAQGTLFNSSSVSSSSAGVSKFPIRYLLYSYGLKGYMDVAFWLGCRCAPKFGTVTFSVSSILFLVIRTCPRRLGRRRRQRWPSKSSGKSFFLTHRLDELILVQVTFSQAVFRGMPWGQAFLYMLHAAPRVPSSALLSSTRNYYHAINAFEEEAAGVRTVPGTAKLFGTYAVCSGFTDLIGRTNSGLSVSSHQRLRRIL